MTNTVKRGSIIGVKHYLNTRLNPEIESVDGLDPKRLYPVYVRLTAKKQSAQRKSLLLRLVSAEEFEDFLLENAKELEAEKRVWVSKIQAADPSRPDFNINSAANAYSFSFNLSQVVENSLASETRKLMHYVFGLEMLKQYPIFSRAAHNDSSPTPLANDLLNNAIDKYFVEFKELPFIDPPLSIPYWFNFQQRAANYFSLLFSLYIPDFKRLRSKYPHEFWDLTSYVEKIMEVTGKRFISITDYVDGEFDRLFIITWNDQRVLDAIHAGIRTLRETDTELDNFMNIIAEP